MVRSGIVLLLLEFGIFLLLSLKGQCTKINFSANKSGGDFDFEIDPQKEFRHTHVLTNDTHYSQYLLKDNIIRYFYILRREHVPLALQLTPCISKLDWNVTLIRRLPEEKPLVTDYEELNDQFRSTSSQTLGVRMFRYTGDDRASFSTKTAESGIYKIDVKPLESDTYVKLYAYEAQSHNEKSNPLDVGGKVIVKQRGKRRLKITWPKVSVPGRSVKYCLGINQKRQFKTHCGFRSFAFGDKPKLKPRMFYYDEDYKRALKALSPVKPARTKDYFYRCMVNKTSHSYTKLRPGQMYYIDVFVVDRKTRQMVSHLGTSIAAKGKSKQPTTDKVMKLSDGKVKSVTLKRRLRSQTFVYDLTSPAEQLMFSVNPCTGWVRMKLYTENSLIKKAKVKSLEYFTIDDAQPNKYYVNVSIKGRKARQFSILGTTRPSKYIYPKLPENTQINVYQSLVKCDSITIGWMVTGKRQKYCIYKRENDSFKKSADTMCEGPRHRKKNERVLCAYFRHRNKNRSAKTGKISNLKPGTDYVFDVYVSKRRLSLPYESVRVRTKDTC